MFPLLGGLISGGIGAISSMFNTSQNNANAQQMQQQAEAFNQQQTQQQEAFQTQMSNTAYQRASADMKAAGLNPMMMANGSMNASTPSGGSSTIQPAQKTSAAGGIGSALQSVVPTAVALKTADATIDNLVQTNANLKTENLVKQEEIVQKQAGERLTGEQAALTSSERKNVEARLPLIADESQSAKSRLALDPSVRKYADQGAFLGGKASDTIAPISNLVSSARGMHNMFMDRANFVQRYGGF